MIHPTTFHLRTESRVLEILWSDDRKDVLPLSYLRGWCPCASCQGHFSTTKRFVEHSQPKLLEVQPVGNYAVQPVWSDGHRTGIYSFVYLRELAEAPPGESDAPEAQLPKTT